MKRQQVGRASGRRGGGRTVRGKRGERGFKKGGEMKGMITSRFSCIPEECVIELLKS